MINTNNVNTYTINAFNNSSRGNISPNPQESMDNKNASTLRDEFIAENKRNGLFEKFYNFCKNKTGLGTGSRKVEQKITEFENGKTSEREVKNTLSNYKISQENAEQNFGDFASATVAISAYFKWSNFTKILNARIETKSFDPLLKIINESTKAGGKNSLEKLLKSFSESKKAKLAILPLAMFLGGFTKWSLLKLNRIGSKEFKVENKNQLDKKEFKQVKKDLNHKRHKENFKNFCTGAINGLLAPVTAIAGGIAGVPAYILATSGIRFLTSKNDDKPKSINNYFANFKNNIVLSSLFTLAVAVPAFKKARYSEVLGENLEKVVKNLKGIKLKEPDLFGMTSYDELENIMLNSPNIKNIMSNTANLDETINKLTNENIFAVKFLQISNKGGELSSKLIESCPPSRSKSDAQIEINRLLNSNKYTVTKLLGVGTVAESYLAKDSKSGKEVCIKILKKGINAEKIQRDKEAFINLVTNGTPKGQLTKSQQYLVKNIENLAEAISKEVDFENEMKAANKLRKSTKKANVVVPIEAKPGIYVMEKAPGISLDTLAKYYRYESAIKYAKAFKSPGSGKIIAEYEKKIAELKDKSPDFNDFNLSVDEIKLLLYKYMEVLVEQFTKVDKNGKTLHADIHPGNIFINLEALKNKKGKLYTLIDTGNTIDLTKEQAASALKLTSFIKNGNVKDITKYVLDGAVLPRGLTPEKAQELVEKDLKTIFFDKEIKINSMNSDELFKLTNNILRKHEIIPNDSQLNLNKAKKSAENSLEKLLESFLNKKFGDCDRENPAEVIKQFTSMSKDLTLLIGKYKQAKTLQESRNLLTAPREILANYRNKNNLKTNSEDYLTYLLKQDIDVAN